MTSIYVAGAWIEQHLRARPMIAALKAAGISITRDWTRPEGDIGVGSDSALTHEERVSLSNLNLQGVLDADIFWLLAANEKGSTGAWVELGAALAARRMRREFVAIAHGEIFERPTIVVSGAKARRTIFTELADNLFNTDGEALSHIFALAGRCKRCGGEKHSFQVFCGAGCSARYEMGDRTP